ncbi:MAG: hypothetical protein JWN44_6070, partial [Myxococcales bacterium]|nr:hypothetical protein [Myxococcales bacterium]
RIELAVLPPGIYALPNDRLGSLEFPKIDRAVELAEPLATLGWSELRPAAQAMLADHAVPPAARIPPGPAWLPAELSAKLQAICVHTPSYGTRSSSLLAIGPRGLEHYLDSDGPPCQTALRDRGDLVAALRDAPAAPAAPAATEPG